MKKYLIILSLTLLASQQLWSQGSPDTMMKSIDRFYDDFTNNQYLQTNILFEKALPVSDYQRFTGTYDTSASYSDWMQMYNEVVHASLYGDSMESATDLQNRAKSYLINDTVPIGVININYQTIHEHADDSGWVQYDSINNELNLTTNQNVFDQERLFSVAPLSGNLKSGETYTFWFANEFFLRSDTSSVKQLKLTYGNNLTKVFFPGDRINVTIPDTGLQTLSWELEYVNGSKIYSKSVQRMYKHHHNGPRDSQFNLTADIGYGTTKKCTSWMTVIIPPNVNWMFPHFNGSRTVKICTGYANVPIKAEGLVSVRRGRNLQNGEYREEGDCYGGKVAVILDGFDYGTDELGRGVCKDGQCGKLGFNTMMHPDLNEFPQLALMPQFIDDLGEKGYDVFYLDNKDGADFLQRNAMLLVKLIQQINANKCDCQELVIFGPSMGGQVAKYALAYMEAHDIKHEVRLYVSFDSPHKGANIPYGAQRAIRYFAQHDHNAKLAWDLKLSSPAAQQLLIYHGAVNTINPHPDRGDLLNDFAQVGIYPKYTRNIALINGSSNGNKVFATDGAELIHFKVGQIMKMNVWSMRGTTGNKIVDVKHPKSPVERIYANSSTPLIDNAPGGMGDHLKDFERPVRLNVLGMNLNLGTIRIPQKTYSFIPATSALDLNSTDYYYNINPIDRQFPTPSLHPFDALYMPTNNQAHVMVSPDNMEWIYHQIESNNAQFAVLPNSNGSEFNLAAYEHEKVPGTRILPGGTLYANKHDYNGYGNFVNNLDSFESVKQLVKTPHDCNPNLEVFGEGSFIIGDASPAGNNRKAKVIFKKGTSIILHPGATLSINDGSTLIIEEGAKLIYYPGAIVNLNGANAILEIQGDLVLKNGAQFDFDFQGSTGGFVRFNLHEGPARILAELNAEVRLNGTQFPGMGNDKVLEVVGGHLTPPFVKTPETEPLNSFRITNGTVEIGEMGGIDLAVDMWVDNAKFIGLNKLNSTGLVLNDPNIIHLEDVSFEDLSIGLQLNLSQSALNAYVLRKISFDRNDLGLETNNVWLILADCYFTENIEGWMAFNQAFHIDMIRCIFRQNMRGAYIEGSSGATLRTEETVFINNEIGLENLGYMEAAFRCTEFSYNTQVGARINGMLSMSPNKFISGYQGFDNALYNNTLGIDIDGSIYLEDGRNVFRNTNMNYNGYPFFDFNTMITGNLAVCTGCGYMNSSFQVYGANNYWDPQINTSMQVFLNFHPTPATIIGQPHSSFYSHCFVEDWNGKPIIGIASPAYKKATNTQQNVSQTTGFSTFPNPANEKVFIDWEGSKGSAHVTVLDVQGKVVLTKHVFFKDERSALQVNELKPGIYMLKCEQGHQVEQQRIVIR